MVTAGRYIVTEPMGHGRLLHGVCESSGAYTGGTLWEGNLMTGILTNASNERTTKLG